MLAITTYCTKNYAYALRAQIPLTLAALRYAEVKDAVFILAGDDSAEVKEAAQSYRTSMEAAKVTFQFVAVDAPDGGNGAHKKETNLGIARMQNEAWHAARLHGAEQLWSLESDILPQPNTLRAMRDVLAFDRGWYDVAMCTYPNAAFLGGRATPANWILPSVYEDERELSDELLHRIEARETRRHALTASRQPPSPEEQHAWKKLQADIEAAPAKGNVWKLNADRWRMRGWLESAYPGIGLGALVPTDWVGLGCTLMSRRALDLAHFTGYDGACTQDLWLCWRAWHPMGLRLAAIPHAVCSHVKRQRATPKEGEHASSPQDAPPKLTILHARHELGGDCHGHLRCDCREWEGV